MIGETDLKKLLLTMRPVLLPDEFVFCSVADATYGDFAQLNPMAMYKEEEGLSLILKRQDADGSALAYNSVFRGITLSVHSSLEAVGFTAAIATKLATQGISANVVAAFHHDHIFVPVAKAEIALQLLAELAE